jgi:hypothetical protein
MMSKNKKRKMEESELIEQEEAKAEEAFERRLI